MEKGLQVGKILVLSFLLCFLAGLSQAQEEMETEIETQYSYGTVTQISAGQIVISEYDYETDANVEVTFTVGPNTELKNANSLEEISVGSTVYVDYVVKDDQRVAAVIEVEEGLGEEGSTSKEEYIPQEAEEEVLEE